MIISAWHTTQHRCRALTIPPSNPWDVANQEQSEQTGWANFDNFESILNIDEKKTGTNNQLNEIAEQEENAPNPIDDNLPSENLVVDGKAVGGGDVPKLDDVETTVLPLSTESIINNKVQNVDSINTADDNANPSEFVGERYFNLIVCFINL